MSNLRRSNALLMAALTGIALGSGIGVGPMPPMGPMGYSRGRGGRPKHYLRRITNEMLSGRTFQPDPARRSLVRPWRSTDGMTGKAHRRQQKQQRQASRALYAYKMGATL